MNDKVRLQDGSISAMEDADILRMLVVRANSKYTCKRGPRPSGAMLVTEDYAVFGDVGPPNGSSSCIEEDDCMMENGHCVRNNHAEVDALLASAARGVAVRGGTCYSINKPCYACTRALIAAGISRIVYAHAVYDEVRTFGAALLAGVKGVQCQI